MGFVPYPGKGKPGHDMPDTPPSSNNCHPAKFHVRRENFRIKNQHQRQSRILNAGFDGNGSPVNGRPLKDSGHIIPGQKRQRILNQYYEENILDDEKEKAEIFHESNHHNSHKKQDG